VCGDGTFATIELDDAGQPKPRNAGVRFFDPDKDPVFMHYEMVGDQVHFISYAGQVHTLNLRAEGVTAESTWSFIAQADQKKGWQPGGYQLFTVDQSRSRMYVGMHPNAHDGSHKTPAAEIWVVDLKEHKRLQRWPGQNAVAMTMAQGQSARLFVLDGATNGLVTIDPQAPKQAKPLARFDGIGDTPIMLEAH
jgi:methylamine dehydrogenase heavy chain